MSLMKKHAALCLVFFLMLGNVSASSNPPLYRLPWAEKNQTLTYRSCGCADSCWVAELREKKTRKLQSKLRCDCEMLWVTHPAKTAERSLLQTCVAINEDPEKMQRISELMGEIVHGKPRTPGGSDR